PTTVSHDDDDDFGDFGEAPASAPPASHICPAPPPVPTTNDNDDDNDEDFDSITKIFTRIFPVPQTPSSSSSSSSPSSNYNPSSLPNLQPPLKARSILAAASSRLQPKETSSDTSDDENSFVPLPPPPTENLNFHGGSVSSEPDRASVIDVFGGGSDLLFASPEPILAAPSVTPLEPSMSITSVESGIGSSSIQPDSLLDLFGSPAEVVTDMMPPIESTSSITIDSILATVQKKSMENVTLENTKEAAEVKDKEKEEGGGERELKISSEAKVRKKPSEYEAQRGCVALAPRLRRRYKHNEECYSEIAAHIETSRL
ncbi:hypothetical protein TL16_g12485, partial [Triparma laevis f. inornata]